MLINQTEVASSFVAMDTSTIMIVYVGTIIGICTV